LIVQTEVLKRGFLFQFDDLVDGPDILFIGINPSYDKSEADLRGSYKGENVLNLPYFKAFQSVKNALGTGSYNKNVSWSHLDLLVFRETNQKFVNEFMKTQGGLDFIMAQLKIAKKLIKHINPKIIVVSNSTARTFMGKDRFISKKGIEQNVWMDFRFKFDIGLGVDRIIDDEILEETPVFFTSMLSGQRALDNGSKERLIWQMDKVLDSMR